MKRSRRNHSPAFKAKVALQAIRGDKTLSELAQQHQVHPTQITAWKQQLLEHAAELFANGQCLTEDSQQRVQELQRALNLRFKDPHLLREGVGGLAEFDDPVRVLVRVGMLVMRQMILTIAIDRRHDRPGDEKIANHVGHLPIPEETEMRRLMHQDTQAVHPTGNGRDRQEIQPDPVKMAADRDGRSDHRPIEGHRRHRAPRLQHRQLLQFV